MNKIILILATVGIIFWGLYWINQPSKPKKLNCYSKQCLEDKAYIESAMKKEWDEFEKESIKEVVVKDNEYLRCTQKGNTISCVGKKPIPSEVYESHPEMFGSATATMSMSPNINQDFFRPMSAQNIAEKKIEEYYRCYWFCRTPTDEEYISALREVYEKSELLP